MPLSDDDVREILRLIDGAEDEELELETGDVFPLRPRQVPRSSRDRFRGHASKPTPPPPPPVRPSGSSTRRRVTGTRASGARPG